LQENYTVPKGIIMKKLASLLMLTTLMVAGTAFAADPVLGTWKLNVEKSKFASGNELKAASRVYTEADGVYTLEQKLTGADGKQISSTARYSDGKDVKQPDASGVADTVHAKKVGPNTWNFVLSKGGKVVGHVHRVVSIDGKTLMVHNTGANVAGASGDETLVYDKQ
jgi:hypothetical protein